MLRDEMALRYDRYSVIGMAYRINLINVGVTAVHVGIFRSIVSTYPSDINTLYEGRRSSMKLLSPAGINGSKTSLKGYISNARMLGIPREKYRDDNEFAAPTGSNPSTTIFAMLLTMSEHGSTAGNIIANINLTYYVRYQNPVHLVGS